MTSGLMLYYVHDPMCSWCWGFRPAWQRLQDMLSDSIRIQYLLGGLAPDTDEPMPETMRQRIQGHWRAIEQRIPGTQFNYDFWRRCQPRRSTWMACRAVVAIRSLQSALAQPMIESIQRAYYLQARNPSDVDVLIELAEELGQNPAAFRSLLLSNETDVRFRHEMELARSLGVHAYPSLVLQASGRIQTISIDYLNAESMRDAIWSEMQLIPK